MHSIWNFSEEFSIFDSPEEVSEENKAAKLIKVQDGEAQKMFSRCPHKQCGHIFETVNEVNNHLLFRHVDEAAVSLIMTNLLILFHLRS